MKTNLQNALQNMAPDLTPPSEQTFTAAVMTRIRARARRRRILTGVAIGLTGAAILTLAAFIITRTLANLTLPDFHAAVIVPMVIIATFCIAMMLGYESIITRTLINRDKAAKQKFGNIGDID